jgi:predicted esterase
MGNTLVFIHGLESTGRGTKGKFFAQHFPEMIIEDYVGDFNKRMNKLNRLLENKNDLIIVGSSYGGLMAVHFTMENENKVKKLILLAPALNLEEFKSDSGRQLKIPVVIYHGAEDDIVNPQVVKEIAYKCFSSLEYHLVKDDHVLHKTFPALDWEKIIMAD